MNLGQIRARIEDELQHAPDLTTWRTNLRSRINAAQREVALRHAFLVSERTVDLYGYGDIEGATLVTETTSPFATVTISGSPATTFLLGAELVVAAAIGSRTDTVQRVVGIGNGAQAGKVILWPGWLTTGTTTTCTIRFRRFVLPYDCMEVLSVLQRTPRQVPIDRLSQGADAEAPLDLTTQGQARYWIERSGLQPRDLIWTSNGLIAPVLSGNTIEGTFELPLSVTTAAVTASSGLAAGAYTYQAQLGVAGSWLGGPLGAPSASLTITAGQRINVTLRNPPPGNVVRLFRSFNGGRPYLVTTVEHDSLATTWASTTYQDRDASGVLQPDQVLRLGSGPMALFKLPGPDLSGQPNHRELELWPRGVGTSTEPDVYELRYRRKVLDLWADEDEPMLVPELHDWLVYRVCMDIAARNDAMSGLVGVMRARADELMRYATLTYQRPDRTARSMPGGDLRGRWSALLDGTAVRNP